MSSLSDFGWSEYWSSHFDSSSELYPARVVAEHRNGYRIQTDQGERTARVAGRLRHQAEGASSLPAVGDWVETQANDELGDWTIKRVLPRKSKFSRKVVGEKTEEQIVAANVDFVWIVSSLDQDFSPRRLERYLTLAWESGATPQIILTKTDLVDDIAPYRDETEAVAIGVDVFATSCHLRTGLEPLRESMRAGVTVALMGSSGVGKSTLINALAANDLQETSEVRSDGKGRHTTTHRQLIRLDLGGLFIDTPGMRELQLWDGDSGMQDTFGDVEELAAACRFSDCQHENEPGCAVREAIEQGRIDEARLASFQKLQRELAYLDRKQDVRAQAELKRKWKSITKTYRNHPKFRDR